MSHSLVLRIASVVMMLFGLALLLVPNALLAMYQAPEMNGPGIYNTMLLGSMLIAVSVLNWICSAQAEHTTRPVILTNLIGNALGLATCVYRQLVDPTVPATAWVNVAIYLALLVMFAQVYLRMRSTAVMQGGVAAS